MKQWNSTMAGSLNKYMLWFWSFWAIGIGFRNLKYLLSYYHFHGSYHETKTPTRPPHWLKWGRWTGGYARLEERVGEPHDICRGWGSLRGRLCQAGSLLKPGVRASPDNVCVQTAGEPRVFPSLCKPRPWRKEELPSVQGPRPQQGNRVTHFWPEHCGYRQDTVPSRSRLPGTQPVGHLLPFSASVLPPSRGRHNLGPSVCSHRDGDKHGKRGTLVFQPTPAAFLVRTEHRPLEMNTILSEPKKWGVRARIPHSEGIPFGAPSFASFLVYLLGVLSSKLIPSTSYNLNQEFIEICL